jgi:type I restriction enzyme S subunit
LDSADLLEVNPDIQKFVLSLSPEEQESYYVKPGWLLAPSSGQTYGNLCQSIIATEFHVGKVLSNHILRICSGKGVRSGYLQCVLSHPVLGRPQLVRFAFGSSVPEVSAEDIAGVYIPRLDSRVENKLADLLEEAALQRDEADFLERNLAAEAEGLIERFLGGDTNNFTAAEIDKDRA